MTAPVQPRPDAVSEAREVAVASAICDARHGVGSWHLLNEVEVEAFRHQAIAATSAVLRYPTAREQAQAETIKGLREALEARDDALAICPFAGPSPASGNQNCPKCGADSTEPCRKRVIADAKFVDLARTLTGDPS